MDVTLSGDTNVDWWLVVLLGVVAIVFLSFIVWATVRIQRQPQTMGGVDSLIGKVAEVKTPLDPKGIVFIHGELWEAVLDEGKADVGEEVLVRDVQGMKLGVTRKK